MFGTPGFATVQDLWFAQPANVQEVGLLPLPKPRILTVHLQALEGGLNPTALFVSDHYFIANSTGKGIIPKFASAKDGGKSFTLASKKASIHAPDTSNVDWLQLPNVEGKPS